MLPCEFFFEPFVLKIVFFFTQTRRMVRRMIEYDNLLLCHTLLWIWHTGQYPVQLIIMISVQICSQHIQVLLDFAYFIVSCAHIIPWFFYGVVRFDDSFKSSKPQHTSRRFLINLLQTFLLFKFADLVKYIMGICLCVCTNAHRCAFVHTKKIVAKKYSIFIYLHVCIITSP